MNEPAIALVTAAAARDLDADLPPLESALRVAGAKVTIAEWDRPHALFLFFRGSGHLPLFISSYLFFLFSFSFF
jgi:hypothetical protein